MQAMNVKSNKLFSNIKLKLIDFNLKWKDQKTLMILKIDKFKTYNWPTEELKVNLIKKLTSMLIFRVYNLHYINMKVNLLFFLNKYND